ncbi:MAG: beta-N-acetylhexosaminidase [Clostridia bacterium]|nr:beta-N-acetylhexosaminidase [Clostridia bacterium]
MHLIPTPRKMELKSGFYYFDGEMPDVKKEVKKSFLTEEGYRLTVDSDGVCIEGGSEKGVFYGEITLKQILNNYRGMLPYIYISDEPEFDYRGFMLDSARHFLTVEEVKKVIDACAYFKLNKFHFHLTDDQGFRFEMKEYPLLTEVGSKRRASEFSAEESVREEYAHYYTKAELKEIVEYCHERYIEVIPEFDIPGHTTTLLAAYPELSCTGEEIEPQTKGGVFEDILCAGNPETMKVIYAVIDEMCEIFTDKYFHIGGDEAPKTRWIECEKCHKKKAELGLRNFQELQGWLMNEVAEYLKTKGKKAICWNDALKGGNLDSTNTVVSLWLERNNRSIEWANSGKGLIVESNVPLYMDYPYAVNSLEKIYKFNPKKLKGLTEVGANSILGIESPAWSEHIRDFTELTYMCFPRWLAVAETAWTGGNKKGFPQFLETTRFYCDVLTEMKITPAERDVWSGAPQKAVPQLLKYGKRMLSPESVIDFIKVQKNELFGGGK